VAALRDGLAYIMQQIVSGKTARFWLHDDSNSTVAQIVRQSYQVSVPHLKPQLKSYWVCFFR